MLKASKQEGYWKSLNSRKKIIRTKEDFKMKILVDLDGSVNTFDEALVSYLKNKGYGFDWDRYNSWDIAQFITNVESIEHAKDVFRMVLDDFEFWESISPMPHAREVLEYYNYYHDIYIATMPWHMTPQYMGVKTQWLRKHFPFIDEERIIFSAGAKWELDGDVIIDDKPEVLVKCTPKMLTIKPNQPYNKEILSDFSFDSWNEIPAILDKCEELLASKVSA
jgi:5'(3')-deoxyribonucleotidase